MGFKENLKAELDYQGIFVKELADKSGISKKTIDHYLISSPREPLVTNAVAIARALGVTVEYLVSGDIHANQQKTAASQNLPADIKRYEEKMLLLPPAQRKIIFDLIDSLSATNTAI